MIEAIDEILFWKLGINKPSYSNKTRREMAKAIFDGLVEKGWALPKWAE